MDEVEKLTYEIIGLAMQTHTELGPGLHEEFYHVLLREKLTAAGMEHRSKLREPLIHRGEVADVFEADLVLPGKVIAELKCLWAGFVAEHYAQIYSYLKFWRIENGLLFDFAKESLIHRRVRYFPAVLPPTSGAELAVNIPRSVSDRDLALRICESIAQIASLHGLGCCDTTYRGLLAADFKAEGINADSQPAVAIRPVEKLTRLAELNCMTVENRCAVLVLALRDDITAADRARVQTYLRHLEFSWGLIVNFGKRELELRWVSHQADLRRSR